MVAPTLMLWAYALALVAASTATADVGWTPRFDYVSRAALSLIIAIWVLADARKRGRPLCYDHDTWLFFAWPILVPVYLFQTRGVRAFLTLFCFAGIWLVALLGAGAVAIILQFASS